MNFVFPNFNENPNHSLDWNDYNYINKSLEERFKFRSIDYFGRNSLSSQHIHDNFISRFVLKSKDTFNMASIEIRFNVQDKIF